MLQGQPWGILHLLRYSLPTPSARQFATRTFCVSRMYAHQTCVGSPARAASSWIKEEVDHLRSEQMYYSEYGNWYFEDLIQLSVGETNYIF